MADVAAWVYVALTGVVVLFQLALAAGAPWGEFAMGGRYPGRYPVGMRVGAVVQAFLLAVMGLTVLSHADITVQDIHFAFPWAIWVAVGITALSTILNWITPSKRERLLWGPVTLVMLACCLVVALLAPDRIF